MWIASTGEPAGGIAVAQHRVGQAAAALCLDDHELDPVEAMIVIDFNLDDASIALLINSFPQLSKAWLINLWAG